MDKTSIVLELQHDALDENVKVSLLLRKALVVARKLDLQDFREWVEKELNGYKSGEQIPDYRGFQGEVNVRTQLTGWSPHVINDPELAKDITKRSSIQSIPEIEKLIETTSVDKYVQVNINPIHQGILRRELGNDVQIILFVSITYLHRPLETVRTIILNWTLNLQEQGILGEGLTFTTKEREAASHVPQNINNFYGPVDKPQIQQGTIESVQIAVSESLDVEALKEFVRLLSSKLTDLELSAEKRTEAESDIKTIEAQISSPNPKRGIIGEALKSLRVILENASGTVAGQLLLELAKLFGS